MAGCESLKRLDKTASQLCEVMAKDLKIDPIAFDGEAEQIDYLNPGALPQKIPANKKLEPFEIYQAYLRLDLSPAAQKKANTLFRQKFKKGKPWEPDAAHASLIDALVEKIRKQNPSENATYLTANSLLKTLKAPKEQGGLGLHYEDHSLPEGNINEVIDREKMRCSEFQYVYYEAARRLGLKAFPIEISYIIYVFEGEDTKPDENFHGAIMVFDEKAGERLFADPQLEEVQKKPPYEEGYYIESEADLFSAYLYNSSVPSQDSSLLEGGLRVTPFNATVLYGLGFYSFERNEAKKAIDYFQATVRLKPNHLSAWRLLCWLTPFSNACNEAAKLLGP